MSHTVEHILGAQNALGEGPVWHSGEKVLYWVDIDSQQVHRYNPALGQHTYEDVGMPVSFVVPNEAGGFVLGLRDGFALWDFGRARHLLKDNAATQHKGWRFNDGAVDRAGRLWAGTMSDKADNHLYRMDADGSVQIMESGLTISNGIGWSPDNKVMYLADSGTGTIYAYDFDIDSGDISRRRVFYQTEGPGVGDGLTVDRSGGIWVAFWDGWKVARFTASGSIEREIQMPVARPTSCIFGGPEMDELYITSASTGLSDEEKRQQPQAGDLFRVKTGIRGIEEPMVQLDDSLMRHARGG